MRIGLTYDLRQDYLDRGYGLEETAEFDPPETIDGIDGALQRLGHTVDRIGGARALASRLLQGDRWDLVFNIAEGMYGLGRESLVPCLLEEYGIPYTFSDPMVLSLSLHKGMCKRVVRDLGIRTPAFAVVSRLGDLDRVDLEYPLFVKPVAEGTGKGISGASAVRHPEALVACCADLLARYDQPVLVEEYLPGREFTVGIVGTGRLARCVGVLEVHYNQDTDPVYSYDTKARYLERVSYSMAARTAEVRESEDVALAAWRGLGCRDGGRVDVRLDGSGAPHFVEVNPLAGLNPVHSDLPILCGLCDWAYDDLIAAIVESARERITDARRRTA